MKLSTYVSIYCNISIYNNQYQYTECSIIYFETIPTTVVFNANIAMFQWAFDL